MKPTYTVHGSKPQLNELQVQTSQRKKLFGNFKNEIATFIGNFLGFHRQLYG